MVLQVYSNNRLVFVKDIERYSENIWLHHEY
jgi:hypothetical protein